MAFMNRRRSQASSSNAASNIDAPPPRLISEARGRSEDRMRATLTGEADRVERVKITLPTLRFMRELPPDWLR